MTKPGGLAVTFTPFRGIMGIAQRLTGVLESRLGVSLWVGDDGLEGVTRDILRSAGIPERPIALGTRERPLSPRLVMQACGVKIRRPKRRALR